MNKGSQEWFEKTKENYTKINIRRVGEKNNSPSLISNSQMTIKRHSPVTFVNSINKLSSSSTSFDIHNKIDENINKALQVLK